MYFQTAHRKRIFGGYISREFEHPFVQQTPAFQELLYADGQGDMFTSRPETWISALSYYKVRYIVPQKVRLPDRLEPPVDVSRWREAIEKVGSGRFEMTYLDAALEAYMVPPSAAPVPFVSVGEGWGAREVGPNGAFRWMGNEAALAVHAPSAASVFLNPVVLGTAPAPRQLSFAVLSALLEIVRLIRDCLESPARRINSRATESEVALQRL